MSERLQKLLARAGLGSRRQIEGWISQGRITVDGVTAQLGQQVNGAELIQVDGQTVRVRRFGQRRRVLAYYKPVGEVSTRHDPEGRPTIFDRLPHLPEGRWVAVGRLDLTTQGLLLLTNDGELAHRLMHPSSRIEREYAVRVLGQVTAEMLERLRQGVALDEGPAHFDEIHDVGGEGVNHWYHVILREGRNREVRRLWESQGVAVSRLTRVRYGPVTLRRGLRPGRFDELDAEQIQEVLRAVGSTPARPPRPGSSRPASSRPASSRPEPSQPPASTDNPWSGAAIKRRSGRPNPGRTRSGR